MKFLIADDEQLVRLTIRTILNNYGIENEDIYQAGTGQEMLAVLKERGSTWLLWTSACRG